jgi:hypothetical protein
MAWFNRPLTDSSEFWSTIYNGLLDKILSWTRQGTRTRYPYAQTRGVHPGMATICQSGNNGRETRYWGPITGAFALFTPWNLKCRGESNVMNS